MPRKLIRYFSITHYFYNKQKTTDLEIKSGAE